MKAGTLAVDLGAAPGGWAWQLVQRYAAVQECWLRIENGLESAGLSAELRFKQLYHDREEVTGLLVISG